MTNSTSTSTEPTAVVGRFIEGILTDPASALALLHPDLEVIEPESLPYGGVHRGRDAFAQQVLGTAAALMDIRILDHSTVAAGDRVLLRLEFEFTSRASGRTLRLASVELHEVHDGLITRIEVFYQDTKRLLDLLETQ